MRRPRWRSAGPALGRWGRTFLWCAVLELALVGLIGGLLGSLLLGLAVSVVVFGPVSLWLAPVLLSRFRRAERLARNPR